ncbi:MAG TPA: H(+)/Cl(-) exchange transporter ClcA [Thermoanaerobaculia bacterium]|jgi:CIC family chloride channel protein|nr:H(+)/Cl(-) exchange transporter ClcA [Thermoanaerobaculia bacterium]
MESVGHGAEDAVNEAGSVSPADISHEIRDFTRRRERRRRLAPRAALVGLFAGLAAAAFRRTLEACDRGREALFALAHSLPAPWGFLLAVGVCALSAGAALWLVRRFAPEVAGSGIPQLKAVLHHLRGMNWRRVLTVKFASGTLGIGAGLALGREGPTVQMGGAFGDMVSRWLRSGVRERHNLTAAGAGAGLAAAFNAPLAGVIFVLEELRRDFAPGALTAAFIASVTADVVARLLMGQSPVFHVANAPVPPLSSLPLFLVLGVLAGLLGVVFNRTLLVSLRLFDRTARWPLGLPAALVGLAIGVIGWFAPGVLGGGGSLVEATLAGRVALGALAGLLLLRFGMTMLSYGTGTAGGIFAPLLVIGAQAGLLVGLLGRPLFPAADSYPAAFAVVGMAALFAAIVRAPLTGIVLILEMTANYSLMLPLLIACFSAYALADLLRDEPIYEALLERDLLRSNLRPESAETLLVDFRLEEGAPFAGRSVADLGLPPGCLLVTVQRGMHSEIPTRSTVLRTGDHVSAVIAPSAVGAIEMLRSGFGGRG